MNAIRGRGLEEAEQTDGLCSTADGDHFLFLRLHRQEPRAGIRANSARKRVLQQVTISRHGRVRIAEQTNGLSLHKKMCFSSLRPHRQKVASGACEQVQPAKKLLFPEPFSPTTLLCIGLRGPH